MSPEENNNHDEDDPESSPDGASHSFTSGGIPKGRELPRSPIKQVTDHLPSLSVPGSVKKIAKSIFAARPSEVLSRPAEVVDEVVQHGEEAIQAQATRATRKARGVVSGVSDAVHDAQDRASDVVHSVQGKAQDVVHGVQERAHDAREEVEEGVVVAIDKAEEIITKAKSIWEDKIWAPSGRVSTSWAARLPSSAHLRADPDSVSSGRRSTFPPNRTKRFSSSRSSRSSSSPERSSSKPCSSLSLPPTLASIPTRRPRHPSQESTTSTTPTRHRRT